jgi:7-keto-8-aminopelargonate synthetase-like enzyme
VLGTVLLTPKELVRIMSNSERSSNFGVTARVNLVKNTARALTSKGIFHLTAENQHCDGRSLVINGKSLVTFGSCSYLGLETDVRLKTASCEAVLRYGAQFPSSRAYVSAPLYTRLEAALGEVFEGRPLTIASTTSLGHLAALPVLITERDAVLYDAFVHASVQAVLPTLREQGSACEVMPHNRLDLVEARANELAATHDRIFYLCDGIYSMHGDQVDVPALYALLDRMPQLHAYIDDAHGMAFAGRRGAGSVLGRHGDHERAVVVLSMAKGMGAAGAVIVTPTQDLKEAIFSCGSTMIFSGPMQPALLGAALASAEILASPEIDGLQSEVMERIHLFDGLARREGLRVSGSHDTPIRFVELGSEETAMALAADLQSVGYFVNVSVFPAVARGHAGVRLVFTRHLRREDVVGLVDELSRAIERRARPSFCAPARTAAPHVDSAVVSRGVEPERLAR